MDPRAHLRRNYGFARQKTRGGSMNLILISWMSFLVDF